MGILLFLSVLLIAACGLIYELVAGTLASYLLGDSVFQFSTVIGSYLFAMGIGSFLSRLVNRQLIARFIEIELMVGVVGGFSSSVLFLAFAYTQSFRLVLYFVVILVGTLVGLEIPLSCEFRDRSISAMSSPTFLLSITWVPSLHLSPFQSSSCRTGLVRSAILFGLLNVAVALWTTFRREH